MSGIHFKTIEWCNFLSTGDTPNKIWLDSNPTTLIIGPNGSGKSTLLDALSFALFGKPHRDINKNQLINSINQKNCLVTVEFSIGTISYKVIRGCKPNIFEIWQDGKMLNQESHSRDYQKILESTLLKLNHKSFHQSVVLGSSSFVPFMQLPAWDRRNVIEELLDISVFSRMNTVLKEKMNKLRDNIKDTEHQIALLRERISLQQKHLIELEQIGEEQSTAIRQDIISLENQIIAKQAELKKFDDEYEASQEQVESRLSAAQTKMQRFNGFHDQIQTRINEVNKEIEFYKNNACCPTCDQDIQLQFRDKKISDGMNKIQEFTTGLKNLCDSREKHGDILQAAQDAAKALKSIHIKSMVAQSDINGLTIQLNERKKRLQSFQMSGDAKKTRDQLDANRNEMDRLNASMCEQSNDRMYQEIVSEMLKDTGIKTKIIKQYVPLINKCINQYLQVLDFFVSFTLDEAFNEKIRSRHRDDFSYASFSEGEKMRINLAILFAWRQIAKIKNCNNTNLLILDETFDSSLDADGVENLLKILGTVTNTNVFVITHKPDAMADKVSAKLEFHKVGLFSQLK